MKKKRDTTKKTKTKYKTKSMKLYNISMFYTCISAILSKNKGSPVLGDHKLLY